MADNKYCNINVDNYISNEVTKINDGFASVENDINTTNQRVNNIVAYSGSSNQEIVDARYSPSRNITYPTLKERIDANEMVLPNAKLVVPQDMSALNFSGKRVVWGHADPAYYGTHRMSYDEFGMFNPAKPDELRCPASGKYRITVSLAFTGLTVGGGLEAEFFYTNYPDDELHTPFDKEYIHIDRNFLSMRLCSIVELHQNDKIFLEFYGINAGQNATLNQNGIVSSWIAVECFELI